jgi:hypothetical protein
MALWWYTANGGFGGVNVLEYPDVEEEESHSGEE